MFGTLTVTVVTRCDCEVACAHCKVLNGIHLLS